MCLTQVGTVSQRFVCLAHCRLRPASSSGTKASRAVQGDRPTLVSCCRSNYLSEAHTQLRDNRRMMQRKLTAIDTNAVQWEERFNEKIGRTLYRYRKNLRDERISILGSGSAG